MGGVTRDKEYEIIKNRQGSRIWFFAIYDTDCQTERVLVHLDPTVRARNKTIKVDFAEMPVKNRGAIGVTVTKHKVERVARSPRPNGEPDIQETPPPPGDDEIPDATGDQPQTIEKKGALEKKTVGNNNKTNITSKPPPKKASATKPASKKETPSVKSPKTKKESTPGAPAASKPSTKATSDFLQELLDFG
jgi:hypothetical protein